MFSLIGWCDLPNEFHSGMLLTCFQRKKADIRLATVSLLHTTVWPPVVYCSAWKIKCMTTRDRMPLLFPRTDAHHAAWALELSYGADLNRETDRCIITPNTLLAELYRKLWKKCQNTCRYDVANTIYIYIYVCIVSSLVFYPLRWR